MSRALLLLAALSASALVASCGDPVHDAEVTALGPEASGVSPGPDHRPGQPCLVCHGGQGPASAQFSLAGTVYQAQDNTVGIGQVQVKITDVNKSTGTATTNSVGNFYITASTYTPTYPADVELDYTGLSQAVQMLTHIGREG